MQKQQANKKEKEKRRQESHSSTQWYTAGKPYVFLGTEKSVKITFHPHEQSAQDIETRRGLQLSCGISDASQCCYPIINIIVVKKNRLVYLVQRVSCPSFPKDHGLCNRYPGAFFFFPSLPSPKPPERQLRIYKRDLDPFRFYKEFFFPLCTKSNLSLFLFLSSLLLYIQMRSFLVLAASLALVSVQANADELRRIPLKRWNHPGIKTESLTFDQGLVAYLIAYTLYLCG